ncbi:MAG: ferredoxin family protein [Lentisphaeraceae bacterium]|nr:ferredoxin family protein [Lentisphaeraceae bacterium]
MTGQAPLTPLKVLLYEATGSQPLDSEDKKKILGSLLGDGIGVHCLKETSTIESDGKEPLCIVGDFETPPIESDHIFITLKEHSVDEAIAKVKSLADGKFEGRKAWKPWFPVIDYDRCTNCMQCLTFCLFDVYSVEETMITVKNEDKCKTDCPACSRVCPEVAILFPKYGKGPINGDVVREEDIKREKMKVDISELLGGNILGKLRQRHTDAKSRFSKERDESKALKERQRCLKELKDKLDIPDSVLASLPSNDMIQAKTLSAQEASEK